MNPSDRELVERLRDYGVCNDEDIDNAANVIERLSKDYERLREALNEMLMYADLAEDITGVLYPCGTHTEVIARSHALLFALNNREKVEDVKSN